MTRRPASHATTLAVLVVTLVSAGGLAAIADVVVNRPLPYHAPDELFQIANASTWTGAAFDNRLRLSSSDEAAPWASELQTISGLALLESWDASAYAQVDLTGATQPQRLRAVFATPNVFEVLGVRGIDGRPLPETVFGEQTAVLSHALWQQRFAADPAVIGTGVTITDRRTTATYRVVGVLPPDVRLTYPTGTDIWLARSWAAVNALPRNAYIYKAIARARPGVTAAQVATDVARVSADRAESFDGTDYHRSLVGTTASLHEVAFAPLQPLAHGLRIARVAIVVFGMLTLAVLAAAAVVQRRSEMAIRMAMGASARRLWREAAARDVLRSVAGLGVAGIILALSLPAIAGTLPRPLPRVADLRIDWRGMAEAAATAALLAAGSLAGFAAAWRVTAAGVLPATNNRRSGALNIQAMFLAGQIALVMATASMAATLMRSAAAAAAIDPGFQVSGVSALEVTLSNPKYHDAATRRRFLDNLAAEIMEPLAGRTTLVSSVPFQQVDRPLPLQLSGAEPAVTAVTRRVGLDYFGLLGMRIVQGRALDRGDEATGMVVSESFARQLAANGDVVGRQIGAPLNRRIVGVVADVRHSRRELPPEPTIYAPIRAQAPLAVWLLLRAAQESDYRTVQDGLRALDADLPVGPWLALDELLDDTLAERRFYLQVAALYALGGLGVAWIGIRALGRQAIDTSALANAIRSVLGAAPLRIACRQGATLTLTLMLGVMIGWITSVWFAHTLRAYLYGVSDWDPVARVGALALVLVAALTASAGPLIAAHRRPLAEQLRHS